MKITALLILFSFLLSFSHSVLGHHDDISSHEHESCHSYSMAEFDGEQSVVISSEQEGQDENEDFCNCGCSVCHNHLSYDGEGTEIRRPIQLRENLFTSPYLKFYKLVGPSLYRPPIS